MGFSGDLNMARQRAQEGKNGVNISVLLPGNGLEVWLDVLAIPRDAANVAEAHAFINAMLDPKTAARNANAVSYPPGVPAARAFMRPELVHNRTIFPTSADLKGSFVAKTLKPATVQGYTRLWQRFRSGR